MAFESKIPEFKQGLKEAELQFLHSAGIILESTSAKLCPVSAPPYGGQLRQDVTHRVSEVKGEVYIGNTLDYALYVLFGTGIHALKGNGRKTPWVYFDENTGRFYMTHGQKPQPYLTEALIMEKSGLKGLYASLVGKEVG